MNRRHAFAVAGIPFVPDPRLKFPAPRMDDTIHITIRHFSSGNA